MEIIGNIITAFIAGGLSLIGVIIVTMSSNKQIETKLITAQAVTDTKLENLTEEVKRHNDFGSRIPVIEERQTRLENEFKTMKDKFYD